MPRIALSMMPQQDFLQAALPLLQAGEVEALEWTVDMGWGRTPLPDWLVGLLTHYSDQGALYGHGVEYSPLYARFSDEQRAWLARMREECGLRSYVHVSEHFGLSPSPFGSPMPQPSLPSLVAVAQDRMKRLAEACRRPVGMENLALALSADDARRHGELLDAILEPVDGFILLDLHNLWCNAVNFGMDPVRLLERYPAGRVRELHLSGGSWATPLGQTWRRDTHNDDIPQPVLDLLPEALERFPRVEVVVVERMGGTLSAPASQASFVTQFRQVKALLSERMPPPLSAWDGVSDPLPVENTALASAQLGWLRGLTGAEDEAGMLSDWLAEADPAALHTAGVLTRKWLS